MGYITRWGLFLSLFLLSHSHCLLLCSVLQKAHFLTNEPQAGSSNKANRIQERKKISVDTIKVIKSGVGQRDLIRTYSSIKFKQLAKLDPIYYDFIWRLCFETHFDWSCVIEMLTQFCTLFRIFSPFYCFLDQHGNPNWGPTLGL